MVKDLVCRADLTTEVDWRGINPQAGTDNDRVAVVQHRIRDQPGGQAVFVEYRAEDASVPIKPQHKMSEVLARCEAELQPLVWERPVGTLHWQHMVIFRKAGR